MIPNRSRRIAAILASTLLLPLAVGTGFASAATPSWEFTKLIETPATVKAGANAGYLVEITNHGPSNIPTLYLKASISASPSYVGGADGDKCNAAGDGPLFCSFGTLGDDESVEVLIAYTTSGASPFAFDFKASTVGGTLRDNGTSRGDSLPGHVSTILSTDPNFAGGFAVTTGEVSTSGLTRTNLQSTKVKPPATGIIVTAEDGLADGTFSCEGDEDAPSCDNRFGEWARINVDGGQNDNDPFKVTLVISGKSVPAGATINTITVIHVLDNGDAYEIPNTPCDSTTGTPTNVECYTVTKVGSNFQIVVWVNENGGLRGSF